jgi:putative SOS response-associated peptidase YedK
VGVLGLVNRWARDNRRAAKCINAKAQTLERLPSFSEAFQKRRSVVPVEGFYEWTGPKNKRQPLWIHPCEGGLLLLSIVPPRFRLCRISLPPNGTHSENATSGHFDI